MGRSERAAALTKRRQAVAVIKNIRYTRKLMTANEFTAEVFDKINGEDRGLEQLVGHSVYFAALTDNEKFQLRRDINAALIKSENKAFEDLRSSVTAYFADMQKVIDRLDDIKITDKNVSDLLSKKESALEVFNKCMLPEGALDYERCMSTLEHLAVIAEEIEQNVPEVDKELEPEEEPEYKEEEHQHDGEPAAPVTEPVEEPVVLPDPATTPVEPGTSVPAPTEGQPEPGVPAEPAPVETPAAEPATDDDLTDLTWIKAEEEFFTSAVQFKIPIEESMHETGFTAEKASAVLDKYSSSLNAYRTALQRVKDAVAPDTCVADHLLCGSTEFFQRFDRLVSLVESIETLRDGLNKSCESLVEASKKMLVATTHDSML